jgi:hypothetical protein
MITANMFGQTTNDWSVTARHATTTKAPGGLTGSTRLGTLRRTNSTWDERPGGGGAGWRREGYLAGAWPLHDGYHTWHRLFLAQSLGGRGRHGGFDWGQHKVTSGGQDSSPTLCARYNPDATSPSELEHRAHLSATRWTELQQCPMGEGVVGRQWGHCLPPRPQQQPYDGPAPRRRRLRPPAACGSSATPCEQGPSPAVTTARPDTVNVNVNELRLVGFSNTTRNPEGILSQGIGGRMHATQALRVCVKNVLESQWTGRRHSRTTVG